MVLWLASPPPTLRIDTSSARRRRLTLTASSQRTGRGPRRTIIKMLPMRKTTKVLYLKRQMPATTGASLRRGKLVMSTIPARMRKMLTG